MGTTRKAPTGARHARCVHHEAYATAPKGWLCFSDETAPTDDAILDRMLWTDELTAVADAHRAAWAERAAPDGLMPVEHFHRDGSYSHTTREHPVASIGYGGLPLHYADAPTLHTYNPTHQGDAYRAIPATYGEAVAA